MKFSISIESSTFRGPGESPVTAIFPAACPFSSVKPRQGKLPREKSQRVGEVGPLVEPIVSSEMPGILGCMEQEH